MSSQFVVKTTEVTKTIDPFIDPGNLLIIDRDPVDLSGESCLFDVSTPNTFSKNISQTELLNLCNQFEMYFFAKVSMVKLSKRESKILELTRNNTQLLFNEIWKLPRQRVDETICAELPKPLSKLPREKPLPEKRQLTKWEQYAQEKGIKNRKRDRKVFDEQSQEWKPRYGYKRAKTDADDWLIEIPDGKDPMVDYFAERSKEKQERRSKNDLQRLQNLARNKKQQSVRNSNFEPLGIASNLEDKSKHQLTNQLHRAYQATSSLGKYQPVLKNEKIPVKKSSNFKPNESNVNTEKTRQLDILSKINAKQPIVKQGRLDASLESSKKSLGDRPQNQNDKRKDRRNHGKSTLHRQRHFQKMVKQKKSGQANKVRGKQKSFSKKNSFHSNKRKSHG